MNMREALATFGVTETLLSADECKFLDEQGYLPLPDVLSRAQVAAFRERLDQIAAAEGEGAGTEFRQEAGTHRLSNLIDKDPIFDTCFTHPRVLAGISHVLKADFKLSSLNSRAALPGQGLQGLHAD